MRAIALVALAGALAGCGGSGRPAARPPLPARPAPGGRAAVIPPVGHLTHALTIAALGDSITAGSPLWDPNPRVRAHMAEQLNEESQYEYWARKRLGPGAHFRNCGIFGERTDQIAARLDACARGAAVLVIQGGINDIAQGRPVADAAHDLRAMARRGRARHLRVLLVEVLPWNNGYPRAAPLIDNLNARIHAIGTAEHVPVLSWYSALEDPRRPGRMRADETIDGSHPDVVGYRRLGDLASAAIVPP